MNNSDMNMKPCLLETVSNSPFEDGYHFMRDRYSYIPPAEGEDPNNGEVRVELMVFGASTDFDVMKEAVNIAQGFPLDNVSREEQRAYCAQHGYHLLYDLPIEQRYGKEGSEVDIVCRIVDGRWLVRLEPVYERPENSCRERYAFSTEEPTELEKNLFHKLRSTLAKKSNDTHLVSICTCEMPMIIVTILSHLYHLEDKMALFEIARKLVYFGTELFGEATEKDYPQAYQLRTRYYICYAPGELEAIAETCYEMYQECGDAFGIFDYDMNVFKARLKERAADIPPTVDMGMFGRNVCGSGLREYDPVISMKIEKVE